MVDVELPHVLISALQSTIYDNYDIGSLKTLDCH